MTKTRNNRMIECCRLAAAFMIIFIHCPFPGIVGELVQVVARFAVPFFLMVSGFFAVKGDTELNAGKKLKDSLRVVIYAAPMCILWNSLNSILKGQSPTQWIEEYLNLKALAEFLFLNRAPFLNAVFYYFFALIYVYVIIICACRYGMQEKLFFLIPPLLMVCIYILNFTDLPWYYAGNWAFTGLPLFILGGFILTKAGCLKKLKGSGETLMLIAGIGLSVMEYVVEGLVYIYLGSIIIASSLLIISINHPDHPEGDAGNYVFMTGSRCSLFIVLFHCQIRDTLSIFMQDTEWWFPVLVAAITLLMAWLWALTIGEKNNGLKGSKD